MPYPGDDQKVELDRLWAMVATDANIGRSNVVWVCLAETECNKFCVLSPQ